MGDYLRYLIYIASSSCSISPRLPPSRTTVYPVVLYGDGPIPALPGGKGGKLIYLG